MKSAKHNLYAMSMAALMLTASVSMAAVGTKTDSTAKSDTKGLPIEIIAPASGNQNNSNKYQVKTEAEKKRVARVNDEQSSTSNKLGVPESVPYENSGLTGAQ